jgi:uncharacterized membrane protein (DUF373 family)
MNIIFVNRKYIVGGKWLRFEKMKGIKLIGFKIAIGKFEVRIYLIRIGLNND